MTSSDPIRVQARRVLGNLQATLAKDPMRAAIDDTIDAVFDIAITERPSSARALIEQVAVLVRTALDRLPFATQPFTKERARDEAAALISSCYRSQDGGGFDSAMLDARDPSFAGMEQLCRRVAATLKSQLQQQYVNWVFARHLDPSNWEVNREIAALLLDRLRGDVPDDAPRLRPEEFVDCIPELFFAVRNADQAAHSLLFDRFNTGT